MCGRYYVNDNTLEEIEKIVHQIDGKFRIEKNNTLNFQAKDICPTDIVPVLAADNRNVAFKMQRWGFPGFQGTQVIFNARSESALEKKMFRESTLLRRIVVPAAGFYEWSRNKEKNIFRRKKQPVLFMAGIYNLYRDEDRFVILTTEANESMLPVHDRMPVILEPEEIMSWIFNDAETGQLLQKIPCLLERSVEFEQMCLF